MKKLKFLSCIPNIILHIEIDTGRCSTWNRNFINRQIIDGHGRIPRGWGGQSRLSNNSVFKRFAAIYYCKVSRRFSKGQKGDAHIWLLMHFCIEKFHLGTLWFPGGGSFFLCFTLGGQNSTPLPAMYTTYPFFFSRIYGKIFDLYWCWKILGFWEILRKKSPWIRLKFF